jgi:diguanylate cyclase (GGDEF)-like protein/hemerythrin-like metal-binding protein/PAS domain S-box-containing protein
MKPAHVLTWSDTLSTGLADLDVQHRRLIDIINELGGLSAQGANHDDLVFVLDELRSYTRYHFQHEADLMDSYPVNETNRHSHLKAHQDFIGRINHAAALAATSTVDVVNHLLAYLVKWLLHHISGVDARMAREILALRAGQPPEKIAAVQPLNDALIDTVSDLYDTIGARSIEMAEMNRELHAEMERRQRIEQALRLSELRFRSLYHHAPVAMREEDWSVVRRELDQLRASGIGDVPAYLRQRPDELPRFAALVGIRDINDAAIRQAGATSRVELHHAGGHFFTKASLPGFARQLAAVAAGELSCECESPFIRLNGALRQMAISLFVMPGHEQTLEQVIVTTRDITDRRQREEELRLAATVLESVDEGVMETEPPANNIVAVNPAFTQLTGYSPAEVIGRNPRMLSSGDHPRGFYRSMWETLRIIGSWKGEIHNRRKNGEKYIEWLSIKCVRDNHGQITHYVAAFSDITERKKSEERISHLALHDVLTDLPNRALFADRLEQAFANARRGKSPDRLLALMFCDLDKFKLINDMHGHAVGDMMLKEAARRMQDCVRGSDTVARIGGDEFVVLLPSIATEQEALQVAEKIRLALCEPYALAGQSLPMSSTIGIAISPQHGDDAVLLSRHADDAMYCAKESGRNCVHLYRP